MIDTKLTLKDAIQFRNIDHKFKNLKKISNIRKPDIILNYHNEPIHDLS